MNDNIKKIIYTQQIKLYENSKVKDINQLTFPKNLQKVLFLSPHYDDEVISCYGALKKHSERKDLIHIVYITDGSASKMSGLSINKLKRIRKREAREALYYIGNKIKIYHFNFVDGKLKVDKKIINKLYNQILKNNYNYIYTPTLNDKHNDHRITTKALKIILKTYNKKTKVIMYEFWTPLINPNAYVSVDDISDLKKLSIECHETQMKFLDYSNLALEINKVRGKQIGENRCEMFEVHQKDSFLNLFNRFEE